MKNQLLKSIYFVGNITAHFKEFKCIQCGLELTNDESGKKISLTALHREINETLIQFHHKRHHSI